MDKRQSLACRLTPTGIRTRGSRSSLAVNPFGSKTMAVWHKHTTCLCQTSQPLLVQRGSSISHNNVIRGRDRDPIPFSPSLMGMCLPSAIPTSHILFRTTECAKTTLFVQNKAGICTDYHILRNIPLFFFAQLPY